MSTIRKIDRINLADNKTEVNEIWNICGSYFSSVLAEIIDDMEQLDKCYCEHRVREFDRRFLPSIFAPSDDFQELQDIPSKKFDEIAKILDSRIILILGNVGTGKSTFVHHFFKVELKKYPNWNIYQTIYVDFKGLSSDQDVTDYANNMIDDKLKQIFFNEFGEESKSFEFLKDILEEDLTWNESMYLECKKKGKEDLAFEMQIDDIKRYKENIRHYNKRRMQYFKNKCGKKVIVVFDNIDHISDMKIQENVYLYGQSLVQEKNANVIMTMRTYNLYGNVHHFDPFSAFNPRYLHLSLPDVKDLLYKRLQFAFVNIKNKISIITEGAAIISFTPQSLKKNIENVLNDFCTDDNINILKKLAYYDLREFLRMVHKVLASGNLFPIERREKYYSVRKYDLLQSLILGNWKYYNPFEEHLSIINLFDDKCTYENGKTLITIRLLETIRILGAQGVDITRILEQMNLLGFEKEDVLECIQKLLNHSLIDPVYPTGYNIYANKIRAINITIKGDYYIDELLIEPRYFENMRFSTFMDKDFYDIMENYSIEKEEERYEGTKVFIEFIEDYEKRWLSTKVKNKELIKKYTTISFILKKAFNNHCERVKKSELKFKT